MQRVKEFIVYWRRESDSDWGMEYIQQLTAQGAVDFAREYCMPDGAEIITVAEVRRNWK